MLTFYKNNCTLFPVIQNDFSKILFYFNGSLYSQLIPTNDTMTVIK